MFVIGLGDYRIGRHAEIGSPQNSPPVLRARAMKRYVPALEGLPTSSSFTSDSDSFRFRLPDRGSLSKEPGGYLT